MTDSHATETNVGHQCIDCGSRWWGGSSKLNYCDHCKDALIERLQARVDELQQERRR